MELMRKRLKVFHNAFCCKNAKDVSGGISLCWRGLLELFDIPDEEQIEFVWLSLHDRDSLNRYQASIQGKGCGRSYVVIDYIKDCYGDSYDRFVSVEGLKKFVGKKVFLQLEY